jgi:hypothetical protein
MPKLLHARPPRDETERRLVCKLATSRHAPADWVWHAKMITRSWEGARTSTIAAEVGSHRRRCASASMPSMRAASTGWA